MIKTESLLYKIDQRLNKLSSNAHQEIPLEDKILVLNESLIILVKRKLDLNNVYKLGLEAFKKRYEDLQMLVEDYIDHPIKLVRTDKYLNKWEADISGVSPEYMFYLDSYVIADKGQCRNIRIDVNNDLSKHADVPTLLNNSNYRPSFEYRETFSVVDMNRVGVFTDGTFTPKTLYLSYLRYPIEIDYSGYVKFDGSDSTTQNTDLPEYLEDELLDIAMESIAMYTENQSAVQYAEKKQTTNE